MEKRKILSLKGENIPDNFYVILDAKAKARALTPFIVELMQERDKYQEVLSEIKEIKEILLNGNITAKVNVEEEQKKDVGEIIEGKVINDSSIVSEVENEEEIDY